MTGLDPPFFPGPLDISDQLVELKNSFRWIRRSLRGRPLVAEAGLLRTLTPSPAPGEECRWEAELVNLAAAPATLSLQLDIRAAAFLVNRKGFFRRFFFDVVAAPQKTVFDLRYGWGEELLLGGAGPAVRAVKSRGFAGAGLYAVDLCACAPDQGPGRILRIYQELRGG